MKCERCGKAVSNVEWDIHTCTPPAQPTTEDFSAVQPAAQPAPEVCCGDYKNCLNPCTPRGEFLASQRAPAAPVQSLPFGVGGGLVAIKTLLSRDPCIHANTAIEMLMPS